MSALLLTVLSLWRLLLLTALTLRRWCLIGGRAGCEINRRRRFTVRRDCLSAAHTKDHLDRAIAAFTKVGKELGVI